MRQVHRFMLVFGVAALTGCESGDAGSPAAAPAPPALSCEGGGRITEVKDARGDVAANVRETNEAKVISPELPEADLRRVTVARGHGKLCATIELHGDTEVPTVVRLNLRRPTPQGDALVAVSVKVAPGEAPVVALEPSDGPSPSASAARAEMSGHMLKVVIARSGFPAGLKRVFDQFGWEAQTYAAGPPGIQYSDCAPEAPYRITYPGGRTVRPANPPGNCF